jgi:hypothetical protein
MDRLAATAAVEPGMPRGIRTDETEKGHYLVDELSAATIPG